MSSGVGLVALLAVVAGFGSRRLARRALAAGPVLVEDRLARTRGIVVAMGISLALAAPLVVLVGHGIRSAVPDPIFFFSPWTLLAVLLVVPAALAGYYPLRREIFGDTWSCGAYLRWCLRLTLAVAGPWALLFLGPALTHGAGGGAFVTAAGVFAGLALWGRYFDVSVRRLLDGREASAEARSELQELSDQAGTGLVQLIATGPDAATWPLVLALPFARPPALFVSHGFLEDLGPAGRRGLFAREIARLARLPRGLARDVGLWALIFGASFVEPTLASYDPGVAEAYRWLWVGGFVFFLLVFSAQQAEKELALDRHAVELLGDDAAARATVREMLTVHATVARWPQASVAGPFPGTLASRQAALGESDLTDAAPAGAGLPAFFRSSTESDSWIAIDEDAVHHFTGVRDLERAPTTLDELRDVSERSLRLPLEDLTVLALAPKRRRPALLATSGAGTCVHLPIESGDEERAATVIQAVSPKIKRALFGLPHALLGGITFFGAVGAFALSFGGWVPMGAVFLLLFTAVFVLLLWRRTAVAAFGAMALSAGIATAVQASAWWWMTATDVTCLFALIASGAAALVMAARRPKDPSAQLPEGGPWMAGVVLLATTLPLVAALLNAQAHGNGALYLAALSHATNGLLFAWVGAGAALLIHPGRLRRSLGVVLLAIGLGLPMARTDTWRTIVAHDTLARGPVLSPRAAALPEPVARFEVQGFSWDLRLSEDGRTVLFGAEQEHDHEIPGGPEARQFELIPVTSPDRRSKVHGYAFAFARERGGVVVADAEAGSGFELRSFSVDAPQSTTDRMALPIDLLGETDLRVLGDTFVLTTSNHERRIVLSGNIPFDATALEVHEEPIVHGMWPLFLGAERALEVESSAAKKGERLSLARFLWLIRPPADLRTIRWWSDGAERALAGPSAGSPWCELARGTSGSLLCVAESEDSRWLWRVDPPARLTPLGQTDAFGWWRWNGETLVALGEEELVVVRPKEETATRLPLAKRTDLEVRFDAAGDGAVLGWPTDDGIEIEVYRSMGASG